MNGRDGGEERARKRRVTLFAKGNVNLRDSLVYSRVNGEIRWNGINVTLAQSGYDAVAHVEHEVGAPFHQVLDCPRPIPPDLAARDLPLGPYALETQFDTRLFDVDADAVLLSIQPSVCMSLCRHRRDGYLLYAGTTLSAEDRGWLRDHFDPLPPATPEEAMGHLERIVARLRSERERPILVLNMSFVVPSERIHWHLGAAESLSTRIRRFNVALVELARQVPISVIDVDDIVARIGAARVKLDTVHYEAAGYRAIAESVARVLADHGIFWQGP